MNKDKKKFYGILLAVLAIIASIFVAQLSIVGETRTVNAYGETWRVESGFGYDKISASCYQATTQVEGKPIVKWTSGGDCKFGMGATITLDRDLRDVGVLTIQRSASLQASDTNAIYVSKVRIGDQEIVMTETAPRDGIVTSSVGGAIFLENRGSVIVVEAAEGRLVVPVGDEPLYLSLFGSTSGVDIRGEVGVYGVEVTPIETVTASVTTPVASTTVPTSVNQEDASLTWWERLVNWFKNIFN